MIPFEVEEITRVAVVCPVHNRRAITLDCLRSLYASDLTGIDLRVVIVDDGSTDGTSEAIAESFPNVEVVKGDGNLFYTAGTNRAIEAALAHSCEPQYILGINDDQIFPPNALRALVDCALRNHRSVVGALLVRWDDPRIVFQVDPQWETSFGGWHHWQDLRVQEVPSEPWQVGIIVGNCVLYPTEAIREVGLMDQRRFPAFGDAEYTPRMRNRGWQLLIEPSAVVHCQPNAPSADVRHMRMRDLYVQLWGDRRAGYNMRRAYSGLLAGAPNKALGTAAFAIYIARVAAKAAGLAKRWPYYEPNRSRWKRRPTDQARKLR